MTNRPVHPLSLPVFNSAFPVFAFPVFAFVLAAVIWCSHASAEAAGDDVQRILEKASEIDALETVIVAVAGSVVAESGYRGHSVTAPTNIKSVSKSVISALVGIAIDKGVLEGTDQRIAPILENLLPPDPDPRLRSVTVGHLLSMQSGLARTSGPNYGRWVASPNWVRAALAQPFVDQPGGGMLYSTGSTHVLSAILTRKAGRSTLDLAREWLGPLDGFSIANWDRDRQGIYFGGNQMAMSPRSLLAFGELYRSGGTTPEGERLISQDWIARSWEPRTRSRFTGDDYGYGWYLRRIGDHDVRYAWGFGGQMLYVVPSLDLTVVMTSDETRPSARNGHRDRLHALLGEIVEVVAEQRGIDASVNREATAPAPVHDQALRRSAPSGDSGESVLPTRSP